MAPLYDPLKGALETYKRKIFQDRKPGDSALSWLFRLGSGTTGWLRAEKIEKLLEKLKEERDSPGTKEVSPEREKAYQLGLYLLLYAVLSNGGLSEKLSAIVLDSIANQFPAERRAAEGFLQNAALYGGASALSLDVFNQMLKGCIVRTVVDKLAADPFNIGANALQQLTSALLTVLNDKAIGKDDYRVTLALLSPKDLKLDTELAELKLK